VYHDKMSVTIRSEMLKKACENSFFPFLAYCPCFEDINTRANEVILLSVCSHVTLPFIGRLG
jgi:hypothetical protein